MKWYYVDNNEKVGPVDPEEIGNLISQGDLGGSDYVWTKGLDNWKKIHEVQEFSKYLQSGEVTPESVDWSGFDYDDKAFYILIGKDRHGVETQYGPYSLNILKRLYKENRINGKTYIWVSGMPNWQFIADIPIYEEIFEERPPEINDLERRENRRRPFLARMLFHNNSQLYEGICRDISLGGMQVLVPDFPGRAGETIVFNVHPENSQYNFVAKGKIVRILDGKQGFSFRFSELNNEAKNAIVNYINNEA